MTEEEKKAIIGTLIACESVSFWICLNPSPDDKEMLYFTEGINMKSENGTIQLHGLLFGDSRDVRTTYSSVSGLESNTLFDDIPEKEDEDEYEFQRYRGARVYAKLPRRYIGEELSDFLPR